MSNILSESFPLLMRSVSEITEVSSIGKSGGSELPVNDESDIDVFVFCNKIPEIKTRQAAITKLGNTISKVEYSDFTGRFWGTIDFIYIGNTNICLMYFTESYMNDEIESVLNGTRLDKESGIFYPTGRCATMLSMYVIFDKSGYIAGMKERLSVYPNDLSKKTFEHHIKNANDAESFESAVLKADVLFYHEVAEKAIDHYLQALFALNKCFFPSRKRSIKFIDSFEIKPPDCAKRLLQLVYFGAKQETLPQSYAVWSSLYQELCVLGSYCQKHKET